MTISASDAVAIAKKHGLNLADAAALQAIADDVEEADKLASAISAPLSREMDAAIRAASESSTARRTFG